MPTLEDYIAATPECPDPGCRESLWWVDHAGCWLCPHDGNVYPAQRMLAPV